MGIFRYKLMMALMATIISLLTNMGLLLCHPATWRSGYSPPPPVYLPGPQFCPDTGKTVCAAVDYYPTERIYNLLKNSRSQIFNITSLFVDERQGDAEPNLSQVITHTPYYQNQDNNYYTMSPTPGGRFSPAGQGVHNQSGGWGAAVQNGANSRYTTPWSAPPNRWQQVPPSNPDQPPPTDTGSWRGPASDGRPQVALSNGYGPPKGPVSSEENSQSWSNNGQRPPNTNSGVKSNTKGSANSGDGRSFVQQRRIPDGDLNLFWENGQQKRYEDQKPQDPHGYRPLVNPVNEDQQQFSGQPNHITPRTPQQWPDPNEYRRPPTNGRNSIKRGKRTMDVEGACSVRSTFIPPRAALNDQSEWKFIINVPERDQRFSQVVRVDLCLNEGDPCSSKLSLPFGFVSRCRQKYIKKKLLSLNADGQGTAEDNFFIPSCCVCELVRQTDNS